MILNYTAEEREFLNKKLENYLRPIRFRESSVKPDASDGRTPFDSDFARVALSAPVRRLRDKTQVFSLPEFDFVRNRLTHSLEVLCIARGLGLGVEKILSQNGLYEIGNIPHYHHAITSILETASLIHDLGNPPFGHKIEKSVQKFFTDIKNSLIATYFDKLERDEYKADLRSIEGNVQGFRILRHLALAKDEFSYNLTMPTMATIIKYPFSSIEGNKKGDGYTHEQEKFGYLQAEASDYYKICDTLGLRKKGQRHPLTYLLEAADDIAFSVCDLEDAFKNENVGKESIVNSLRKCDYLDSEIDKAIDSLNLAREELDQEICMQDLRIKIQSKMIIECTKSFCNHYKEIIEGTYKGDLMEDSKIDILRECCKQIVKPIYEDPEILANEGEADSAVNYILDGFLEAILLLNVNTPKTAPEYLLYKKISPNYRKVACEQGCDVPTVLYKKFLLATDYVFGMTDRFLLRIYKDEDIHDLIQRVKGKIDTLQLLEERTNIGIIKN